MFNKRKIDKSRVRVNLIINDSSKDAKQKVGELLNEFNKLSEWFFKSEEYESELMTIIDTFFENNGLDMSIYL